ncbi:LIC_13387 family protein [Massilia sp. SYSU DXS3249]
MLIATSAGIILLLGLAHLLFTFYGARFMPRDRVLQARMREVAPVISRETTIWKAWIGFNASHSFGAILFGAVYGYLALMHQAFLSNSAFLLSLGLLLLCGYVVLAKRYWFSTPLRGILLALTLYVLALLGVWG